MNARAVTIVIPVWNGRDLLLRLLDKLRVQTLPVTEILAVDNGSEDGAADAAERQGARVLRLGSNQGFSRAVNTGIEACRTELVALVNSDVEPEPDWLEKLADAMQSREAWFATGKILSASDRDRIDGAYDLVSRGACAWRAGHGQIDSGDFSETRRISMASATAALFRTDLFHRVGLFDTRFESYLEDVDFGLRCAAEDLPGIYVPEAVAYHWASASLGRWSPAMVRLIARNQVFLAVKHFPLRRYWWPLLVGQSLWGLLALRHGAGWAFLRGKWDGWRGAKYLPKTPVPAKLARIVEQSEREIREAQRGSRSDFYWSVYFLLTSAGTD